MKKTRKSGKPVSADAIALLAERGRDITHFFKGQGRIVQPIQRINVDVTATMLDEPDSTAREINVSAKLSISAIWRDRQDEIPRIGSERRSTNVDQRGPAVTRAADSRND